MSFGTFTLFGFYQQPNTGVIPQKGSFDIGSVIDGSINSGRVADFNGGYPYAQTAIPIQVIEGGGGLFQLSLFSDYEASGVNGLRYATVQEIFSGEVTNSNIDNELMSVGISGEFFPMDSGMDVASIVFSGVILQTQYDNGVNSIIMSGNISSIPYDAAYNTVRFSGNVNPCAPDVPNFIYRISGSFYPGNQDLYVLNTSIRGSFSPANTDLCNISYGMSSFSGSFNKIVSGIVLEDECNITYGFDSFSSAR